MSVLRRLECAVVLAVALAGTARHLVASVFHADGDFGGLILVSFFVSTHRLVVDRVSFYGARPPASPRGMEGSALRPTKHGGTSVGQGGTLCTSHGDGETVCRAKDHPIESN